MDNTENKELFLSTFRKNVQRPGAEKLLAWMETTDFFTAPASTRFHAAYEGGLLDHSMNVYNVLISKHFDPASDDIESFTIVSLLHDLCKAGFYKTELRNRKNDRGEWEKVPVYTVDDQFPYGHGEKSLFFSLNAKCTLKLMRLWQFVGIWVNLVTKTATQSVRHMTSIRLP